VPWTEGEAVPRGWGPCIGVGGRVEAWQAEGELGYVADVGGRCAH